jgi:hypothetical protein
MMLSRNPEINIPKEGISLDRLPAKGVAKRNGEVPAAASHALCGYFESVESDGSRKRRLRRGVKDKKGTL